MVSGDTGDAVNMMASPSWHDEPDFSLVNGGLLYQLFRFLKAAGDGRSHLLLRVILFFLPGWVPLLILSAMKGTAISGELDLPFLRDLGVYTRFLAAVPLLLIGEVLVDRWLRDVVGYIRWSGLVPEEVRPAFNNAIRMVSRLRDSVVPELGLLLPVIILFLVGPPLELREGITSWKTLAGTGRHISPAGWWYALVSLPLYQFLLFRWLWRFLIWACFLWRLSRLSLRILATHPDRAGGLGFMAMGHGTFGIVIFAASSVMAVGLAEQIVFAHASLPDFEILIATYVLLVLMVFLAPLAFFSPLLISAKRRALSEYATLVDEHHRLFAEKWFRERAGREGEHESILGNPDASSLADINSGYETVHNMVVLIITPRLVIGFALATLLPMAPLVLTIIPFKELLTKIAGILL